ncbi:MAG: hypothetical protein ACM3ML_37020 [Micromonosporaceae bacterium]
MKMLTCEEIDAVGPIDTDLVALWADVQLLADAVHMSTDAERQLAWHHLLLAVGNYKAQAPLFAVAFPSTPEPKTVERKQSLRLRAGGQILEVSGEVPSTWQKLAADIRGLGVARTTTILSALWPGQHVMMDWRTLSAALALTGARLGWDQTLVDPASIAPADSSWPNYEWYRRSVLDCATRVGKSAVEVERALWQVGREAPGTTWAAYAQLLEQELAR